MKRIRIYSRLIIIVLVGLQFQAFSQANLQNDQKFITKKIREYESWLELTNFCKVLRIDSFHVGKAMLTVYMGSHYNDTYLENNSVDSLAHAWESLKKNYALNYHAKLEKKLFNNLAFTTEVGRDSLKLKILGKNPYKFLIDISYNGHRVKSYEKIARSRLSGTISIPQIKLNCIPKNTKEIHWSRNLEAIRKAISDTLLSYYKSRGTPVLYSAKIEVLKNYEYDLIFEVTNISHEILYDIGYFEYIRIVTTVKKEGEKVEITYRLQGKYGSGIFRAPRKSDYKNIETKEKYIDYMIRYEEKLKNMINIYLTQKS